MENQDLPTQNRAEHGARMLEAAKQAPQDPGVYLMKDPAGTILYVGKAKNLKNRLSSYFQRIPHETPRTEMLVSRLVRFDVILTETESEALILENTLIKKHRPKFNVRLKDDKAYPYIRIAIGETYPRLEWTRRVRRDGARYFGPFPSAWSAKQILRLLTETFQLRDCSDNTFRHRSRPCILYQMGKCSGPCVGIISADAYRESIENVVRILEGKSDALEKELQRGMDDSAEREEYEEAAYYRDQLENLRLVTSIQVADEADAEKNRDVVAIARTGTKTETGPETASASSSASSFADADAHAHAVILQIRAGRLVAVRHMTVQNGDGETDDGLMADFLAQYYLSAKAEDEALERADATEEVVKRKHAEQPSQVLLASAPKDLELLERTLGISVRVPESDHEKQLVSVAATNARHSLEQSRKRDGGHGIRALEEIQDKLHLAKLPARIECYDNSNIQGEDAVASRVVFVDGAPDKNLYRRYKIRTVEGANDFATMKEVLGRRFSNIEEALPDLVVVDGGKGQLSQAVAILEELNIQGVAVVGLAKARTERDFRAKEVASSLERIFIPGRKNPVPLLPHMPSYKLLTHIRDEAHRFAITYHRKVRDKRILKGS